MVFAKTCKKFVKSAEDCEDTSITTHALVSCGSCLLRITMGDASSLSDASRHLQLFLDQACDDTYFQAPGVQDFHLSFYQFQQRKQHQIVQHDLGTLLNWKQTQKVMKLLQIQSNNQKNLQFLSQKDLPRVHTDDQTGSIICQDSPGYH